MNINLNREVHVHVSDAFEESKHPRGHGGLFASSVGGKTEYAATTASTSGIPEKQALKKAREHAKHLREVAKHENVKVTKRSVQHTIPGRGIGATTTYTVHHGAPAAAYRANLLSESSASSSSNAPKQPTGAQVEAFKAEISRSYPGATFDFEHEQDMDDGINEITFYAALNGTVIAELWPNGKVNYLTRDANYEEGKHRRDNFGRWGAGVGKSHVAHIVHHQGKRAEHSKQMTKHQNAAVTAPTEKESKKHLSAFHAHGKASEAHGHAAASHQVAERNKEHEQRAHMASFNAYEASLKAEQMSQDCMTHG